MRLALVAMMIVVMVGLKDIAKHAGVSVTTVSLALRDNPRVSAAMRTKLKALAAQLGYIPNPLVSAYQSNVRRRASLDYAGTLGWIYDHPARAPAERAISGYTDLLAGARDRALAQSYKIEVVTLPGINPDADADNARNFQRILAARGIVGVIVPPLHVARLLDHDWSGFALVAHGAVVGPYEHRARHTRAAPALRLNQVAVDHFNDCRKSVLQLAARGCKRIVLLTSAWHELTANHQFTGGYFAGLYEARLNVPAPPFEQPVNDATAPSHEFRAWLKRAHPDGLVTVRGEACRFLETCGLSVPADVSVAHLNLGPGEVGWSGVRERHGDIGAFLADMAIAQLHRNERGVPSTVKRIVVPGDWIEGGTTRERQD